MKKLLAVAMVAVMLVGCGSGAATNSSSTQAQQGGSEAAAPAAEGGGSDTLVLYTARAESLNNAVIENFQADTGIKVEIVTGSTGEVTKRVQS